MLKPGGRLYVNSRHIIIVLEASVRSDRNSWVHMFFSEDTLVDAYKELCKTVPDGDDRINFRISTNAQGKEVFLLHQSHDH